MSYTLGQAAKATGKNKTTIQRAIIKGRISASKDDAGTYAIDPAELHRVFPAVTIAQSPKGNDTQPQSDGPETHTEITMLRVMLTREQEINADLREDRDSRPQRYASWWSCTGFSLFEGCAGWPGAEPSLARGF